MAASFGTLHLQPSPLPTPPTPKLTNPILVSMDLLTEILLRLPAKSLIRFKSVCKEWLSLISSDYFCHQHTLRHPKLQPSLILKTQHVSLFYFNPTSERLMIPHSLSVPDYNILEACNGLMLLKSLDHLKNTSYYVYNPTTRQSRKITLTSTLHYPYVAGISLAFDPSKSPYYKIVCIRSTTGTDSEQLAYQVEVYDSESHTWKLSLAPFKRLSNSGGVHWKNSIYWRSGEGYCYFDIAKDEMRTLSAPQAPASLYEGINAVVSHLQESNGHLFHYELMLGDEHESVGVWELGEGDHHCEWLLKHHHLLHPHPTAGSFKQPSCIVRLEEGEGTCRLLICGTGTGTIRAYDFLDKSYEDLVDITSLPFYLLDEYRLYLTAYQFGESLALV